MATVTVELRNLLKTDFELFDFEYTFDDPNMKKQIEQAVIDYYYFEEIGQETPDRFKHVFETRYKRIIGYYNKLYNTTLLEYEPLVNYKMTEALERLANTQRTDNSQTDRTHSDGNITDSTVATTDNTTTSSTSESITDRDVVDNEISNQRGSDYPQQNITTGDYLSEEQDVVIDRTSSDDSKVNQTTSGQSDTTNEQTAHSESDSQGNEQVIGQNIGKDDTTETYEKSIEGLTGRTYQELVQLERDNLLRITSMIIQELKPCFILTY